MAELIIMFVCGFFFAVSLCGLFLLRKNYPADYPSDEEMDQMCLWYEAEYGKENEK